MRLALSVALTATLVLAGCGGDDSDSNAAEEYAESSSETIAEDLIEAMGDVESVRMAGTVTEDGEDLELDVEVNTDGECEGTIGVNGQGTIELLHLDGVSYFKADEEFWRAQAGDAADQLMSLAGDNWVTNSSDPNGFGELCDFDNFVDALEGDDTFEVEGVEEIDGEEAVKLSFESDDGNEGVAYIAGDDPHRILRFDVPDEGRIDFTEYDDDFSVEKPDADEIVDLADLG